jgi:hypothetical protein
MIFTIPAKGKNSVKTIIGDELSSPSEFLPSIKLSRWDDEVSLKIGFDVSAILKGQRVFADLGNSNYKLSTPRLNFKIYSLPPDKQMEDGGLEFEIILKSKPPTNIITMPIETAGLDFFYQPPLTQEEIDHGAMRPENVIGSYAVYHSTKNGDYSNLGGKNYRAGKAFHIFRPKVTDNLGAWIWAYLDINKTAGQMMITIPQAFLDSAIYPVTIDPTIGNTGTGASTDTAGIGTLHGSARGQADATGGTASKVTMRCYVASGSLTLEMGYYSDKAGPYPDALIAADNVTGITVSNTSEAWKDSNAISGTITANAYYWPAFLKTAGTPSLSYKYDAETGGVKYVAAGGPHMPATFPGSASTANQRVSIYITYAAGGATYNEGVTLSSTPALSPAAIADLLAGVGLASSPGASMIGGMDYADGITLQSGPAVSLACILDIFPSLALLSNPALGVSALADFYNALTLASTPAVVMAAIADLLADLALASDPAFVAVGGSDFYDSVALSSDPAFSSAAFKDAFGELSLLSSPAFAASALADLLAEIAAVSSPAILAACGFDFNEVITLLTGGTFAAGSSLAGGPITSIGAIRAAAGLSNKAPSGLKKTAGAGLRRDA